MEPSAKAPSPIPTAAPGPIPPASAGRGAVVKPTAARIAAAMASPRPVFRKNLLNIAYHSSPQRSRDGWLRRFRYKNEGTDVRIPYVHRGHAAAHRVLLALVRALRLFEIVGAWFKAEEFNVNVPAILLTTDARD